MLEMMFHSLRLRLLGGFLLVAIVAVGGVAVFASQVASGQFRGYVERRIEQGRSRYEGVLSRYYADQRSWEGVQSFVERMGEVSGDQIVLLDSSGTVIADSARKLLGRQMDRNWVGGPIPVMGPDKIPVKDPNIAPGKGTRPDPSAQIGSIFVNPLAAQEADNSFLDAVNRWLIIATGAAGVLALMLTLAISRRILDPIESLTYAAKQMEKGDLEQRVDARGRDEVAHLARAFNAMAEAVSRNEMLRRHMVSDVAHELRTPLTNIRGYLEGLRDGVFAPDSETIESLCQEAESLNRVVDDLQEVALAEAGQLRLQRQTVRLEDVIERAVGGIRPQFAERELKLEVSIPSGLPLIEVDAGRIGQVLRNLLSNAKAHTPRGGTVTLSVSESKDWIEVRVADSGAGIASQDLPYVFERFYRADKSRTRATGGAGLGLTIARQMVEAHGGQIKAASEPGQGATFTFAIPISGTRAPAGQLQKLRGRGPSQ